MSAGLLLPLLLLDPPALAAPGATEADCVTAQGGGCDCREEPEVVCEGQGESGTDSDDTADTAVVEGGGHGCSTAWGRSLIGLLAAVAALLRRRALGAACVLFPALILARPALAADAQHLQVVDGGTFLSLQEARFSGQTAWRASLASSYARAPVVLRSARGETPYLEHLLTLEPAFTLDIGSFFQVGAVWPLHLAWVLDEPAAPIPGDLGLRIGIPLLPDEPRELSATWAVQVDLRQGGDAYLLGDRGAIKGALALGRPIGGLEAGLNLGLRLQEPTEIPGATWGNRLELGFGLSRETFSRLDLSLEALGSAPLGDRAGGRALYPLELLAGLRRRTEDGDAVRLAVGLGLGSGLGAPALRLALAGDVGAPLDDDDKDGLVDLRDLCPQRPEDRDEHRDVDGCPDPDNDRDGLADQADTCPDEAEVYNRYQDEDGCPDVLTVLRLTVQSAARGALEQATVTIGELPPRSVLAGEPFDERLPTGSVRVRASAEGHQPAEQIFYLPGPGVHEEALTLVPRKTGTLRVQLTGAGGQALAGQVEIDGALLPVPAEGATLSLPVGSATLLATAPQHAPARASAEIPFRGEVSLTVPLAPVAVDRLENRLTLSGELGFALDQATLRPEDLPLLDALAAWLRDHPEVRLLRVEGHADEVGAPAYNYDLSLRRATAVLEALVARGVAAERLQAVGTGEAVRPRDAQGATRRVELLVLIWEEGG